MSVNCPKCSDRFQGDIMSVFFFLARVGCLLTSRRCGRDVGARGRKSRVSGRPAFARIGRTLFPALRRCIPVMTHMRKGGRPRFRSIRRLFGTVLRGALATSAGGPSLGRRFVGLHTISGGCAIPSSIYRDCRTICRVLTGISRTCRTSLSPEDSHSV